MEEIMNKSMGFYLGRTNQKLINYLAREFKEYNITPEQWVLLNLLRENEGISQRELADKSGKDQTTITRALDNLHKKNIIKRLVSPNDRRILLIFMTDNGIFLMEQLIPIAQRVLKKVFKDFTQDEEDQLRRLLSKLYNAI